MSLLGGLNKDDNIERSADSVGFSALESDVYEGTIKQAYGTESDSGAKAIALEIDLNGRTYKETIYFTSGKEKGQKPYYETKQGKKVFLPGYQTLDDLCAVTTEQYLASQETEEKKVKVYNKDAKKELPTDVEVLVDLIGKKVKLGIVQTIENKWSNGVQTSETTQKNSIDKVFNEDGFTLNELLAEADEPEFINTWLDKNKGVTKDKSKAVASSSGSEGSPKKSGGLFGKK